MLTAGLILTETHRKERFVGKLVADEVAMKEALQEYEEAYQRKERTCNDPEGRKNRARNKELREDNGLEELM